MVDLSLFGWSLRALGFTRCFDGPARGERVTFNRTVSVHYGRVSSAWGWGGRLFVTDRRIVSCWGHWSRSAVLEIARADVTEVRREWLWWYPCVRVGYRRKGRHRSIRIVDVRLKMLLARTRVFEAFRQAGYPVA